MSLRLRLMTALLTVVIAVTAVTLALSLHDAKHEIEELFDAEMAQSARALMALIAPQLGQRDINLIQQELDQLPQYEQAGSKTYTESGPFGHAYEKKIAFQFISDQGQVLLRSINAPEQPMRENSLSQPPLGFRNVTIKGEVWRVFSIRDSNHHHLLQVGERQDLRQELATMVSKRLITPGLVALPVLSLLVWLAIGRGLAPIVPLMEQVTRRDPGNLTPIDDAHSPKELKPLIRVLNELFVRLQRAFESERQFTGDAAHELRTPLAALKTQAQVALRANSDEEKQTALKQVIHGVNRSAHLLEQLLTLARLDHNPQDVDNSNPQVASIPASIRHIRQELQAKAVAKQILLQLEETEEWCCSLNPHHLSILVRNLVENAIHYSPAGKAVRISLQPVVSGALLTIADTGPGISEAALPRIFDRFYRGQPSSSEGCGLGLSIVKRISDLYSLKLALRNQPGGGLAATVEFPQVYPCAQWE